MVISLLHPAAGSANTFASQSMKLFRFDDGIETLATYTTLSSTGTDWRARGTLSWWRWNPGDGTGLPSETGPGTLDVTLGRSLWRSYGAGTASRGWLQLKGFVPLRDDPSPLSSGELDWGFSVLSANRRGDFLVFLELGYLIPGDPAGLTYEGGVSGAVSASWHRRGAPVYPVASFVAGSPLVDGDPEFGEWSAGIGAALGDRTGILALYSQGTTAAGPDQGFTLIVTLRP